VTILVPRGAEARAVRQRTPNATVVEIAAGAASAQLPPLAAGEPVVVVGLCGALGDLRVGDVVVYRRVADEQHDLTLDGASAEALAATLHAPLVDAWCVDHVVTTVAERRALAARSAASVVDMEGTHLAAVLAQRGIPFAIVRVVSDDAARDLPEIENAVGADGHVDALRIAAAFVRAPRAAYGFVRDVRRALRRLGDVAVSVSG
jgi:nucleoside phosphorylase